MAIQTSGFQLSTLPQPYQVPGNLGVVKPPLDPQEILALAQQHLSALNQARQAQVQQEQLGMEQQRLAGDMAARRESLATAQQERQQRNLLFRPQLQSAQTAAAQGAQNLAQDAETFAAAAPVRALAGERAALERTQLGPTETVETSEENPNGSYTIKTVDRRNGQVVKTETRQSLFPAGGSPAMLRYTAGKPLYDSQGREVSILQNGMGSIIRRDTGEEVLPGQLSAVAPSKVEIQKIIDQNRADIATRAKIQQLRAKAAPNLRTIQAAEQQAENINRNIDRLLKNIGIGTTGLTGKVASGISALTGIQTRGGDFAVTLESLNAQQIFNTLTELRKQSPTGSALGQVTQKELPLLQSAIVNIKPGMSDELFRENLDYLKYRINQTLSQLREAYAEDERNGYAAYDESGGERGTSALQGAKTPKPTPQQIGVLSKNPQLSGNFDAIFGQGQAASYLAAIKHLQQNPNLSGDFDAMFGVGAAENVLK